MKRQSKSIFKERTAAEKKRHAEICKKIEKEKPEILAKGRAFLAADKAARRWVAKLKAEREKQGLSLAEIKQRSGISREAISVLENADAPNPTIRTLQRYAQALGVKLDLVIR